MSCDWAGVRTTKANGPYMQIKVLSDDKTYEGKDAAAVLTAMKDSSPFNRALTLEQYMPKVREWSGIQKLDTTSPEAFLESLAKAGMIEIQDPG